MDIKTTLKSLMMLGIIAALLGGATYAVFSDTETNVGNQMIAGTIDMAVDGQNPWTESSWAYDLQDMKPGVIHYGTFEIENVGLNPMKVYKRLTNFAQDGGTLSEPECVEGGGVAEDVIGGLPGEFTCSVDYVEECNIAAYTLYDMTININGGTDVVILSDDQEVRLDIIENVWIYLGEIPVDGYMTVTQSYVLKSWTGAPLATITNWAQGDRLTFNVELYGEQVTGTGPDTMVAVGETAGSAPTEAPAATMTLLLDNKEGAQFNPTPNDAFSGVMTYNTAGPTFDFAFTGVAPTADTGYSLIYYPDPWGSDITVIATGTTDSSGAISIAESVNLDMDLPAPGDTNDPVGAKIWLVLTDDIIGTEMEGWNQAEYLFEMNVITYDDTDA